MNSESLKKGHLATPEPKHTTQPVHTMNSSFNPIRAALTLAVTLLLLAGGHTALAQHHDQRASDAEAKECPMMAEGAAMEDCPMMRNHDGHSHGHHAHGERHHHGHEHADMEKCPMMAEGASMDECPMKLHNGDGHDHSAHDAMATQTLTVAVVATTDDVPVIEIAVGPGGYEPSELELKAGVTTQLVFTRTAEGGCVGQVQIPDLGIEKTDLPLGEAVTIEVTPTEAGTFRFACGMNMVRGTILVRE
jgi:hypothetical protein